MGKRIFGPKNDLGGCASSHLNRWAAALGGFDFTVVHIKGTSNRICDRLSRLPSPPAGALSSPAPDCSSEDGFGFTPTASSSQFSSPDSSGEKPFQCSPEDMCTSVACLAQLPVANATSPVTIFSILGGPDKDPWNVLPVTAKDV